MTARRRRSVGSSMPCSAIRASMPPIVRRLIVAPAVCGPFDSDGVKPPAPFARLVVADAVATAVPLGR